MKLLSLQLHCTPCQTETHYHFTDPSNVLKCKSCGRILAKLETSEFQGYVYILSNKRMIDLFKVGYTERDPIARAQEISNATGVPEPYVVEAYFPSVLARPDESLIHDMLNAHRTNPQREFFAGPFHRVYDTCRETTGHEALYINPAVDINVIESYDPWRDLRPARAIGAKLGKPAQRQGKNFLCVECGKPMRPVKKHLQDRGIFRGCGSCGFFVNNDGLEMSPRR